jgi:hypothetical protein
MQDLGGAQKDLDVVILEAILDDCASTVDAIMHAVKWSEPSVIESQARLPLSAHGWPSDGPLMAL